MRDGFTLVEFLVVISIILESAFCTYLSAPTCDNLVALNFSALLIIEQMSESALLHVNPNKVPLAMLPDNEL